jgi:hypothetical protein
MTLEEGTDHMALFGIVTGEVLCETGSIEAHRLKDPDQENGTTHESQSLQIHQENRVVCFLGPGEGFALRGYEPVNKDPVTLTGFEPTGLREGSPDGATQAGRLG